MESTNTCLSGTTAKPEEGGVGWRRLAQHLTAQCGFNNTVLGGVVAQSSLTAHIQMRVIHFCNHWFAPDNV